MRKGLGIVAVGAEFLYPPKGGTACSPPIAGYVEPRFQRKLQPETAMENSDPMIEDATEAARRVELERALRLLERGIEPVRVLEDMSRRLTNKLLHAPTKALLNDA